MDIQKVKHLHLEEAKKAPDINHSYLVTEKIDGWYVYTDFNKFSGWGDIMSSRHRPIPSMKHCTHKYLNTLGNPKSNCRLIMEAYIPDTDFHITNGIFNRSKGVCDAEDIHFKIHDIFYYQRPNEIAIDRYRHLISLEEDGFFHKRFDVLSALTISSNKEDWLKCFDLITYNGGEGVILKQANGVYCPGKRNSSLMKIKLEDTLDLLCTGVYETFGEKGNRNLNIKVIRKNGLEVTVRVGKHEDIAKIDEDNNNIIGKVCEIKCMKELDGGMLREPRFVRVREDKNVEEID